MEYTDKIDPLHARARQLTVDYLSKSLVYFVSFLTSIMGI